MQPIQKRDLGQFGSAGGSLIPVRFEFTNATALTVAIAGTFNDWHPTTRAMHPVGNGLWLKEAYLAPGNYEYCLVVDGKFFPDLRANAYVPNPFGGMNSTFAVIDPTGTLGPPPGKIYCSPEML